MNLKDIDYLSPEITLFYYGNRRHATNFGAILTILLSFISAFYIVFLILNICNHQFSNFIFYRNYIPDLSQYYFNDSSGIFHYFQLYDSKTKTYGDYQPKYARIIMSRLYKTYQENQESLYDNEHWVYGLCNQGIDNKNIDRDAFNEDQLKTFENSACLKYYYNNINHTYFKIDDKKNFKYPYLIYGTGNNNNLYLETVVEKCENTSITNQIFGFCGPQEEIDNYFKEYNGIYLRLIENKFDIDNYKKQVNQYIYDIGSSLNINSVPVNNINLSPFEIDIQTGIVIPRTKKIIAYSYEENRLETWESKNNKKILSIFEYWIQNTAKVMKGSYRTIFDILPNIGGFIQLIHFIFYTINFLYNQYVILVDSNQALFKMENTEDPRDAHIKKILYDDIITIREEVKLKEERKFMENMKKRDSIFITKIAREKKSIKSEIDHNKLYEQGDNKNLSNSKDLINSNLINITLLKKDKKKNINTNYSSAKSVNVINPLSDKISQQFSSQMQEFFRYKNRFLKEESLNVNITSHFISFCNYLMSFFKYQYKKRIFFVLNNFRKKILAEEHIFRANIILFHLIKYFDVKEMKKIDILDFYENL